jgi:fimbrial chaperone protein
MRTTTVVLIATLGLLTAGVAHAAQFQVAPTQVALGGDHHTGSVTITNRSNAPVRFQVTALAWSEGEDGAMKLVPTDDLVVYPTLFTVDAGASRSVRLASMATPGAQEVPYRIFVEELPAPRRPDSVAPTRITMRTRMGIPVFLPPTATTFAGDVTAQLAGDDLTVRLRNRGTAHVRVATVEVIGAHGGDVAFDLRQAGWYLLPGGARRYHIPLAASDCAGLTGVRVVVVTDHGTWRGALAVTPGACAGPR